MREISRVWLTDSRASSGTSVTVTTPATNKHNISDHLARTNDISGQKDQIKNIVFKTTSNQRILCCPSPFSSISSHQPLSPHGQQQIIICTREAFVLRHSQNRNYKKKDRKANLQFAVFFCFLFLTNIFRLPSQSSNKHYAITGNAQTQPVAHRKDHIAADGPAEGAANATEQSPINPSEGCSLEGKAGKESHFF